MPSFRLGKHSNRSQHDQLSSASAANNSSSSASASSAAQQQQQQQQPSPALSAPGPGPGPGQGQDIDSSLEQPIPSPSTISRDSIEHQQQQFQQQHQHQLQQQQQQLPHQQQQQQASAQSSAPNKLQKAPPQQLQQLQQQQQQLQFQQQQQQQQGQGQPPAPPPHLYNAASASSAAPNNSAALQHTSPPVAIPSNNSSSPNLLIPNNNSSHHQLVDEAGNPVYVDARQLASPVDPSDPAVNRSQSLRYPPVQPPPPHGSLQRLQQSQQQQQQLYGIGVATSSLDDIPSPGSFQQQQPPSQQQQQQQQQQQFQQQQAPPHQQQQAPQKRSARGFIKGIFGGSSSSSSHRSHHDDHNQSHSHNHSYDNTGGLARRPSKRVSNSNNITNAAASSTPPNFSVRRTNTLPLVDQKTTDSGWRPQHFDEDDPDHFYYTPQQSQQHLPQQDPNSYAPSQDSRIPPINTLRQVSNSSNPDLETSPYEDVSFQQQQHQQLQSPHPHQLQSPIQGPGGQHPLTPGAPQDQQFHFDQQQGSYNNTQPPGQHSLQPPGPYGSNNNSQQDLAHRPAPVQTQGQDPRLITTGHLGPNSNHPQNAETASQLSHESPTTDVDPRNQYQPPPQQTSPAVYYAAVQSQEAGSTPQPPPIQTQHPSVMAPGGPPSAARRGQESEKALRGAQIEPPAGPPPGYRHSNSGLNPTSPLPPQGPGASNASFRDREQYEAAAAASGAAGAGAQAAAGASAGGNDQGRNSPQPSTSEREGEDKNKELVTKYKHVKRLYFDGKKQIETLQATNASLQDSIAGLQDAVANQRMSQSRTALDDNEYATRFTRLNGAIKDLSFNIRKDWKTVPPWVEPVLSAEALKTAKQEMTAVGRAVISRWIFEEIFNKTFHPGLDPQLSAQLKDIERGIRGNTHTLSRQEEFEALTNKIVNWRMATLDGLQRRLDVNTTTENRTLLVTKATTNLAAFLQQYNATPSATIEGSFSTIIEIAVGISANLPLESRDVAITYPLPGDIIRPDLMEVDKAALPSLGDDSDNEEEDDEKHDGKLRFAGFMTLEVRGRQVLMKAPVWPM